MSGLIEFELWNKGEWPRRDVVGESFHADAIRALFPRQIPEGGQELTLRAALLPEPQNPHDRNAVKVLVAGHHVGYLSRDDAPHYQPVLNALVQRGFAPSTGCRVWGSEYDHWIGQDKRGRDITRTEFNASVSVSLDEWFLCVPINEPPEGPHVMLPYSSAIQVRKEENHQEVLRRYVTLQGQCWVYGTLAVIVEESARSSKQLVEVRIDENRIGDLTPAMSADYIPIIQQLAERRRATGVRMIVKGNQVKAEVVLHAQKSHQLDSGWIAEHLAGPGPAALTPATRTITGEQPDTNQPAVQTTTIPGPPRIPPKPSRIVFRAPPGWPPAPDGWEPWAGWQPGPEWPPAPPGWEFWGLAP